MAIDTAEKRKSIRGIGGRRVAPGVTPNAGQDQEWRQEAGRSYSGILAGAVVFSLIGDIFLFTDANWHDDLEFFLEASFRATTGTADVRLFDLTDTAVVGSSTLSTASGTLARARSVALTLIDTHEYQVQVGAASGDAGAITGAKLIVI